MVLKWAEFRSGASAVVLTACATLLLAACSDDDPDDRPDDHPGDDHDPAPAPAPYTERGEYEVGTFTRRPRRRPAGGRLVSGRR